MGKSSHRLADIDTISSGICRGRSEYISKENHLTEPEGRSLLTLSGQQRALLKALEGHDQGLVVMYRGGLMVLADANNPDRLSLCAHAIREVMEKLPEYLSVSVKAHQENLKDKVQGLSDAWSAIPTDPAVPRPPGCDGKIDRRLTIFLGKAAEFFQWFFEHHPRRRKEVHGVLERLDGSGRSLPASLAELNVDTWEEMKRFFIAVLHHRKVPTDDEFSRWLDALERFLLDRLLPRTFEDFAEIDALLKEDGNADS
jgi:hypothetical protein